MTTLSGCTINQVPVQFDMALGFDPGTGAATMYGYVLQAGTEWEQTPDLKDIDALVAVASPSQIDRYLSTWPKISQGDWSLGERQVFFANNPQRYYQTDGNVDVSTPGHLSLLQTPTTFTYTNNGTFNTTPITTGGSQWFGGVKSGANNFLQVIDGTPTLYSTVCNAHEIMDMFCSADGVYALTDEGLWAISAGTPPTSSQVVADTLTDPAMPARSLAYYGGFVFYLKNNIAAFTGVIRAWDRTAATVSTVWTANRAEPYFSCICSTASGLFFSTTSQVPLTSFLYTYTGSSADTPTRVGEIAGRVEYAMEALGTTYILMREFQTTTATGYGINPAWSLYALVGNQLSLVDDASSITDPTFAPTCTSVKNFNGLTGTADFKPGMWRTGRFLYIAWPGLAVRRIDLISGGISQIGANITDGVANVSAVRVLTNEETPLVVVAAYGTTTTLRIYRSSPTSGSLTTSFFDWSTAANKYFRSLLIDLAQPLPGGGSIGVDFRVDNATAWTAVASPQVLSNNQVIAYLPTQTKGQRIQFRITLNNGGGVSPVIRSYQTTATLGRVWKGTAQCHRNQQLNNGQADDQGKTAKQLLGNLENIFNNAGRAVAFLPSLTASSGAEQVNVVLESYSVRSVKPGMKSDESDYPDYEGVVDFQLREDV